MRVRGNHGDGSYDSQKGKNHIHMNSVDLLSENKIQKFLGDYSSVFNLEVFEEIDSTNTYLKERVGEDPGLLSWHTAIASSQTAGRGRMGRSFASPAGTGLYLSVLLRPNVSPEIATRITTAAAVCACRAIKKSTDAEPKIKWVNDIYVRDKKVCGILTEASIDPATKKLSYVVMGIGFNVYCPEGGFPEEIKDIAGAITTEKKEDLRCRLAAEFLKEFYLLCSDLNKADFSDEYKRRCFILGKDINVISGNSVRSAKALDLDPECRLIVKYYDDGSTEAISSGEVSIRL